MQQLRQTSIALSIVLLSLSAKVLAGLTCPAEPWLGLVLAISGVVILVCRVKLGISPGCPVLAKPRRRVSLLVAMLVLAGAYVSTPVLKLFAWRLHEVPLHRPFYYMVASALPGVSRSSDMLSFWTGRGLETIRPTFEGLGLYEVWYLAVGLATFGMVTGRRPAIRASLRLAAVIGLYALMRSVVVTALAIEFGRPELMWRPLYAVLSWLPVSGLLRAELLAPTAAIIKPASTPSIPRGWIQRKVLVPSCVLGMGLIIAFVFRYEDPGYLKQGRIMIDETHSDWEWADEPFDTTAYGIRAEYNYYNLREYLGDFHAVSLNSGHITAAILDSVDVLIIKTPTESFTVEEIDAIQSFVAAGGGLLLIGDHTNLFGMSTHLNEIAERFDMKFRCDDTFDIATTGFSKYRRPVAGFHPAVREVREFGFLTSCSIEGGMRMRPVMIGCGLGSEEADYAHPNFFGDITYDLHDRFGLFVQAAATKFGRGRVMLFSDSTCFSNFCIFGPGRCELALGLVDYLNRRGKRYPFVAPMMVALLGVMIAVPLVGASGRGGIFGALLEVAYALPVMLTGIALGLLAASQANAALHGELPLRESGKTVLFDTGHTAVSFFTYPGVPRPSGVMGFEALYLCAQRIGAHPCTGRLEDLGTNQPAGLVIVNPSRTFSEDDLEAADTFLRDGGVLLLLDSISNGASTANQLLRPYGLTITSVAEVKAPAAESMVTPIVPRLMIQGGMALRNDEAGRARVAFIQVGAGAILVATDSFSYSHHVLGSLLERSRPSELARSIYSEVYVLLGNLIRRAADKLSAPTPRNLKS